MRRTHLTTLALAAASALLPASAVGADGSSGVVVTPASIDYGGVRVGTTSTNAVLVDNTGSDDAVLAATLGGSDPDQWRSDGACPDPLPAGSSCSLDLSFSPTSVGDKTATLTVADQAVTLAGSGIQPAASVSPAALDFGRQTVSTQGAPQTVTVANTGNDTLAVAAVSVVGTDAASFTVDGSACVGQTLLPRGNCAVTVSFVPGAPTGPKTATLEVVDDAPGSPQQVALQGTAASATLSVTPSSLTFARQDAGTLSARQAVVVENTTAAPVTFGQATLSGAARESFVIGLDHCTGHTLDPDTHCTVRVRFLPATGGSLSAVLALPLASGGELAVPLQGVGRFPADVRHLHAAVGCDDATLRWIAPDSSRLVGIRVFRRRGTVPPASPGDGHLVHHPRGHLVDPGLRHFTSYSYAVFASYRSDAGPDAVVYSRGLARAATTGRVCRPRNHGRTRDLSPLVTWLPRRGAHAYAILLQRRHHTRLVRFTTAPHFQFHRHWRYAGRRRHLVRGHRYTIFTYAYTRSAPRGEFIGQTRFRER